ncbi:MAG: alpha/beta fold hydrolase [Arenicella sp.]
MNKPLEPLNIVFLHGWGVNSAVWNDIAANIDVPYRVHLLDIPGFGSLSHMPNSGDLTELAQTFLETIPNQSICIAWSLGGMIALQAALLEHDHDLKKIAALQLICTSAKFISDTDWEHGVALQTFSEFSDGLASNYQKVVKKFLLLQLGASPKARPIVKHVVQAINQHPEPSADSLQQGLKCLKDSDLRKQVMPLDIPAQVISGKFDVIAHPLASQALAKQLNVELLELETGHAPFLTEPVMYINTLMQFIAQVKAQV